MNILLIGFSIIIGMTNQASLEADEFANNNEENEFLCQSDFGLSKKAKSGGKQGMVWIESGYFTMGNDNGHADAETGNFDPMIEEKGEHKRKVDGFWIDRHEVSNQQFAQFVDATGYLTLAEQEPKKEWYPAGVPDELLVPGSAVFVMPKNLDHHEHNKWWQFIPGANWRHPEGPASDIRHRMNHPVVHIAYEDAIAYAKWAGKDLPTEAQWEYAAKAGLKDVPYAWGKQMRPANKWMANTWQGVFPMKNTREDGYASTAPVGCFPPNAYGLFDMVGNVWEMVKDDFKPFAQSTVYQNKHVQRLNRHVIKGGSFLCSPSFCMRYRPSARQGQDYFLGASHVGFRTVLNDKS